MNKRGLSDKFSIDEENNYILNMPKESEKILINKEDTSSPGIFTYHANSNFWLSLKCFYDKILSPWWYGLCWNGNFFGDSGYGAESNEAYWTNTLDKSIQTNNIY